MSIATNSVLRRILDEVRNGPVPRDLGEVESAREPGQILEVRRTRALHRPPFATSLHFWAHSLRAFLWERERPDVFDALAVNCLCDAVDARGVGPALAELARRMNPAPALGWATALEAGYRMIDQEGMTSWVVETTDEFASVFWVRTHWLGTAQPVERD